MTEPETPAELSADDGAGTPGAGAIVPSDAFRAAIAARRASKTTAAEAEKSLLSVGDEFIPDIPPDPLTEYQEAVNTACADITFQEVFEKLFFMGIILGSAKPIGAWRGDSNKFFCPDPSHDNAGGTMSAWGSKDKGTWYCPKGCGQGSGGGDKFTLAGYLFPGRDFHETANLMAATFRGVAKPEILKDSLEVSEPTKITSAGSAEPAEDPYAEEPSVDLLRLFDWRAVLEQTTAKDTFLHQFCEALSTDSTPEEFNLPLGMMAISLIAGRTIQFDDNPTITPNMGLVLVGGSGDGKSRAIGNMSQLLAAVDPEPMSGPGGVTISGNAGSGQQIVRNFICEERIVAGMPPARYPVRCLIKYGEFSTLANTAKMQGSIIKDMLHDVLDGENPLRYESGAAGKIRAYDAFGCVVSTVQTTRMVDLFSRSDAASGFMNRFVFVMGSRKESSFINRIVIDRSGYTDALKDLKSFVAGWPSRKTIMLWAPEAEALGDVIKRTEIEPIKRADKMDVLQRLDLYFKRFCGIFAINERSPVIQLHHVHMAHQMMKYIVPASQSVSEHAFSATSNEMNDWLIAKILHLERKGHAAQIAAGVEKPSAFGPTFAELKREFRRKGWEDDTVKKALKSMAGTDVHAIKSQGKRGPATDRYYVENTDVVDA